jgi:hypothetical protein
MNNAGSAPRGANFGNSTLGKVGPAAKNDLVDVDSIMSNRNVKLSKCKTAHLNPINLTTQENVNYNTCNKLINPEHSRLTYPASNYRDVSVNRFYNLLHDPQANIFQPFARNSRLEAKDNFKPELPELWDNRVTPHTYTGQRCGVVCQSQCQS